MAQSSHAPETVVGPFSVIGPQFVAPTPLEITVYKHPGRHLVVTDINHRIMLIVKPFDTIAHRQRVLLDADDKPIATLREKNLSMHTRWNAFKGESKADSDMIFSTKEEHMIHFKTNICVMLANKTHSNNDDCDLKIKGSWSKGNCTIFLGHSSTEIAKMHKPQSSKYAKDKYMVTIQANMDYACVIALLAIVDDMENAHQEVSSAVVGGVAEGAVGAAIGGGA